MAKTKGAKRKITGQNGKGNGWGAAEHEAAKRSKIDGLKKKMLKTLRRKQESAGVAVGGNGGNPDSAADGGSDGGGSDVDSEEEAAKEELEHRRTRFAHDTLHKNMEDTQRLRLKKTRNTLIAAKSTLSPFDHLKYREEAKQREKQEAATRAHKSLTKIQRRIKAKNLDPENWKLKGAARPAHEVYDFDVNFVDVHIVALDEAKLSKARSVDLKVECGGRFSAASSPQPVCLDYLGALRDHGEECVIGKKYKEARDVFREGVELDGLTDVFGFRGRLLCMFLEVNKPESVRRFMADAVERGEVVRSGVAVYANALVEFVSGVVLEEEGSSEETARVAVKQALKSNLYIGLYLSFYDMFQECVEYGDEIDLCEEGGVLEAIKFGSSRRVGPWMETEGFVEFLREEVLGALVSKDTWCDWKGRLNELVGEEEEEEEKEKEGSSEEEEDEEEDEEEEGGKGLGNDAKMFAGMILTAMEMVSESGVFDGDKSKEDGGEEEDEEEEDGSEEGDE